MNRNMQIMVLLVVAILVLAGCGADRNHMVSPTQPVVNTTPATDSVEVCGPVTMTRETVGGEISSEGRLQLIYPGPYHVTHEHATFTLTLTFNYDMPSGENFILYFQRYGDPSDQRLWHTPDGQTTIYQTGSTRTVTMSISDVPVDDWHLFLAYTGPALVASKLPSTSSTEWRPRVTNAVMLETWQECRMEPRH